MSENTVRVPPSAIQAEEALLCSMLIRPALVPQVGSRVEPTDLYREANQLVLESVYRLGEGVDLITLLADMRCVDTLDKAGGEEYVSRLTGVVSTSAGWQSYCDLILEASNRRKVIFACAEAADRAYNQSEALPDTLISLREGLRNVEQSRESDYLSNVELVRMVVARAEGTAPQEGVQTGYKVLDQHIGTIQPGNTCYLAARSSTGKTALPLGMLDNVLSSHEGTPVLYSIEMTPEEITRRRLSARSGTMLSKLRWGTVPQTEWPEVIEAADYLSKPSPIVIGHSKFSTIETLVSYTEGTAKNKSVNVVIIDHIQRMRASRKTQSRHHELSYVSECLCGLAKDLHIPVIILCQLKRTQEDNPHPKLSDLKESGDIENNADIVLGLWRHDKQNPSMEVCCLKYRDGEAGWTEYLDFDRFTQRFKDGIKPDKYYDMPDDGDV